MICCVEVNYYLEKGEFGAGDRGMRRELPLFSVSHALKFCDGNGLQVTVVTTELVTG